MISTVLKRARRDLTIWLRKSAHSSLGLHVDLRETSFSSPAFPCSFAKRELR